MEISARSDAEAVNENDPVVTPGRAAEVGQPTAKDHFITLSEVGQMEVIKRSDDSLIRLIKRAARIGADIIKRGRMTIGWAFDPRTLRFHVAVFVAGVLKDGWVLKPSRFGQMFLDAPHWIGGGAAWA